VDDQMKITPEFQEWTDTDSFELPKGFFLRTEEKRKLFAMQIGNQWDDLDLRPGLLRPFSDVDPRAIPALTTVAEEDPLVSIRRTALSALRRTRDPAAIPALLNALKSDDPASRAQGIKGLEALKAREAVPALVALLDSKKDRTHAAEALVAIRDERALEPIRDAANRGWPRSRRILRAHAADLAKSVGH
jgi:HEAT repeat protein